MKNPQSKLSRRDFLRVAGAGGAAATLTLAAKQGSVATADKPDAAGRAGKGYHLTDHIRNYYRTAKV